uniref:Uncharacterized protein n=1 Tax=Arundo donax TaxID=35708 RepID=A0A0A9BIB6_ARUDO
MRPRYYHVGNFQKKDDPPTCPKRTGWLKNRQTVGQLPAKTT